ncbi:MAG: thiamine-phosphate kinase [Isosphaeraceae bacterium]|nr:thiamine-phosphate kinase [Isosphaeraceae bacterium]
MTTPEPASSSIRRLGEFDLIAALRDRTPRSPRVAIGIGDDCAALAWPDPAEMLITTDLLMEGRHFLLGEATPRRVGYKCLAVNLSDIAAMAGEPVAAVVATALPRARAERIAAGLHDGMLEAAEEFGVDLVGGDTNAWDGPLVVGVTLIGKAGPRGPVRRSGARPGDAIFVTGPLGGSLLGRHLSPRPRIREAIAIHERCGITAMIDISDGLASDLGHILTESGGLGAVLDAAAIPIHPDAEIRSRTTGRLPLDHALTDGEDFELCFTLGSPAAERLVAGRRLDGSIPFDLPIDHRSRFEPARSLHCIGRIVREPGLILEGFEGGRAVRWDRRGFDHLLTSSDDRDPTPS